MSAAPSLKAVDASRSPIPVHPREASHLKQVGGLSVCTWDTPWIHSFEMESEDTLTLAVHRSGRCNVRALERDRCSRIRSEPGRVTSIPSDRPYAFRVDGAVRFETIHIPRRKLSILADRHSLDADAAFRFAFRDPLVSVSIDSILNEARRPGAHGGAFVEAITEALVLHLLRSADNGGSLPRAEGGAPQSPVDRACALLSQNSAGRIAVGDVAIRSGLSRSHLTRRFRAEVGESPHRYQCRMRVEHAKQLLRETDLSLAHIAIDLGFSSQSHFTQVFRTYTGITPGRYRSAPLELAS